MNVKRTIKSITPDVIIKLRRRLIARSIGRRGRKSVSMSQAGQDYWVYGEVFNEDRGRYFIDIGAHDGVELSNTFILEKRYHWKGLCIEGNPDSYNRLKNNRTCTCINVCVDKQEGLVPFALRGVMGGIVAKDCDNNDESIITVKVKARTLESILIENKAPKLIDYLTIDIEGSEDRALLDFPFSDYRFNCITIERPSESLRAIFKTHGYILIKEIPDLDCFYIHRSFLVDYRRNLLKFGEKKHFSRRWM